MAEQSKGSWWRWIGGSLLLVIVVLVVLRLALGPAEPTTLVIGPDTTVVDGPVWPDGTIDYIAAYNQIVGEGVTNENNAAIPIIRVTSEGLDSTHRRRVYEALNLTLPEDAPQLVEFVDWATAQPDVTEPEYELEERFHEGLEQPWRAEELPLLAEYLEAMAPVLDQVERASHRSRWFVPAVRTGPDDNLIDAVLPHLASMRQVARLLDARAHMHLGAGDADSAIYDLMTIERLARLTSQEPTLISNLVPMSLQGVTNEGLASLAASGELSPDAARQLGAELNALPPRADPSQAIDIGERFMGLELIMMLLRGGPTGAVAGNTPVPISASPLNPNVALRELNEQYDQVLEVVQIEPLRERVAAIEAYERQFEEVSIDIVGITIRGIWTWVAGNAFLTQGARAAFSHDIVDLFTPMLLPTGTAFIVDLEARAMEAMRPAVLALGVYRHEHGEFPESLDALVPEYLDAIPADYFDGEPLRYRLTDDAALLYSVGPDFEDDGGLDEQDAQRGQENYDVVIQLPRPNAPAE